MKNPFRAERNHFRKIHVLTWHMEMDIHVFYYHISKTENLVPNAVPCSVMFPILFHQRSIGTQVVHEGSHHKVVPSWVDSMKWFEGNIKDIPVGRTPWLFDLFKKCVPGIDGQIH